MIAFEQPLQQTCFSQRKLSQPRIHSGFSVVALLMVVFVCLIAQAHAQSGTQPVFVYTGGNSAYGYSRTTINGYSIGGMISTLTPLSPPSFSVGAFVSDIVAHPSGNFVYAAILTSNSNGIGIAAYTIDALTGGLTPVPGSPYIVESLDITNSNVYTAQSIVISPSGKFLYFGNPFDNEVSTFAINTATGALTAASQAPVDGSALVMDPSGAFLYASDSNGTYVYSVNATTGQLNLEESLGGTCRGSDAIDSSGRYLYCAPGSVDGYTINGSTGKLNGIAGDPILSSTSLSYESPITDPAGPYFYISEYTHPLVGTLHGFTVDTSTGELTEVESSPFALPTGSTSFSGYVTDPQGQYFFATNEEDGVAAYAVNPANGALALTSSSYQQPGAEYVAAVEQLSSSLNLVSLSISPSDALVPTSTFGNHTQFLLTGTYSDGSIHFLTDSATWSSSVQSVATVSSGLATAVGYGTSLITASFGGMSASTSITVAPPVLSSVTVTPTPVNIHAGATVALVAVGNYNDGSTKTVTQSATWKSSQPTVASVDDTGLVTANAAGSATISATYEDFTGSSSITVVAPITSAKQFEHLIYTAAPAGPGTVQTETGIYGYWFDGATGALTPVASSPFVFDYVLGSLQADPSGNFLYATTEKNNIEELVGFSVDAATGGVTQIAGSPFDIGSGSGNGPVAITPSGAYLYYFTSYFDYLNGLSIDPGSGIPSPISQEPTLANRTIYAMAAQGNYLYTASEKGTTVYSINPGTGALSQVQVDPNCVYGEAYTFSEGGQLLYCQTSTDMYIYQVDVSTGEITLSSSFAYGATVEYGALAFDPTGSYLYTDISSTNKTANEHMYRFSVDPITGALTPMQDSPIVPPGFASFNSVDAGFQAAFDPTGKYLFMSVSGVGIGDYPFDSQTGQLAGSLQSVGDTYGLVLLTTSQPWSPDLTWSTPAAITYGTALSETQLDATAGVPGTFTYTPVSGTVLTAGQQQLGVSFTPTDNIDYTSATASVTLTVNQATPAITWAAPPAITYGAALSSTQLDATASVPGSFVYSPAAGTMLHAGAQTLTVKFMPTDNTDYTSATATVTIVVNQAKSTITWSNPAAITYGTTLSSTQLDATASVPGSFSYLQPIGTLLPAGSQTLTVEFYPTDSTDYATATKTVSLTVNKASQTITFNNPGAQALGTPLTLTATASSGLAVTYSSITGSKCTVSGSTVTFIATGTCTIYAEQTGNSNYLAAAEVPQSFTVNKEPQTITFANPGAQTYGTPLTLTASATSGLAVTFSSITPSKCTVSANTAMFVASGTCTIDATQTGNSTYAAAMTVSQSFTINKASQTITFANPGVQAIGVPLTLAAAASSGLPVTFSSITPSRCTISGTTATFLETGTCIIYAEQTGNGNYSAAPEVPQSFTVKDGQAITFANPGAQTYGTPLTLSASATSGLPVTFVSITPSQCTVSGSSVTFIATGTCAIDAMQAGNSTYAAAPTITQIFTINKGTQTITFANPGAQTVGTPLTLAASASSGLAVTFSTITPSRCTVSGVTATFIASGACTIVAEQAGNSNYAAATNVSQSFTVNKEAQTITFANPGAQTVGTPLTLSATASSGLAVTFSSLTPSRCTVSGTTATFIEAGACTIVAEQTGNGAFSAAPEISQSFTVNAN